MIKLFKVKEKQRELAENSNGKPPVKKQSAGELRLHKGKFCSYLANQASELPVRISNHDSTSQTSMSSYWTPVSLKLALDFLL